MADEYGSPHDEGSGTDKAKEKARELKDTAEAKVESMAAKAQDRGEEAVREGKEKARELGDEAAHMARSRAEEQKARVVGGMRTVADALRNGTDSLPEDQRQYGGFLETVADRVDGASRYLEQRDVDGLTREARTFAREHAPLFLGGAFALGLAGARFLKSSGSEAHRNDRSLGAGHYSHDHDTGRDDRGDYRTAGTPRPEQTSGTVPMQEPGTRLTETRQPYDAADRTRAQPTRPYPRSSTAREATDRIKEEGGYGS